MNLLNLNDLNVLNIIDKLLINILEIEYSETI